MLIQHHLLHHSGAKTKGEGRAANDDCDATRTRTHNLEATHVRRRLFLALPQPFHQSSPQPQTRPKPRRFGSVSCRNENRVKEGTPLVKDTLPARCLLSFSASFLLFLLPSPFISFLFMGCSFCRFSLISPWNRSLAHSPFPSFVSFLPPAVISSLY